MGYIRSFIAAALIALTAAAGGPASAQQILGQPRVDGGNLVLPGGPTLGRYVNKTWTPIAPMPTAPDAVAPKGYVDLGLSKTFNQNLWFNPDASLGNGKPQNVANHALVIYGPNRWNFQQATLTPFMTMSRVTMPEGDTAIMMLNGMPATGSNSIASSGTKSFNVGTGKNLVAGFPLEVVVRDDIATKMIGTVQSYTGSTLTMNITSSVGSGTYADWVVGRNGHTTQGITTKVTNGPTAAGSDTLNFSDTTGIEIGANIEFAYDGAFNSINGIQLGAYVVSKTATTVKMSKVAVSPTGAPPGVAVVNGQAVRFYGDQGVYGYQDPYVQDTKSLLYGTALARDSFLSFDIQTNLPGKSASIMFLGYQTQDPYIGRAFVQSFGVPTTRQRVSVKLLGDKVGRANTWRGLGDLWGALGFAFGSTGGPTSQNIPDGAWIDAPPAGQGVGGSANQTFQLGDVVGAWVKVTNVKWELDQQTAFQAQTTLQNQVIDQHSTGSFWTGWNEATTGLPAPLKQSPNLNRMERVFIGSARKNSGDFPSSTKDWVEQFEADRSHVLGFRTSWSQMAAFSENGGIGGLFAARTSDSPPGAGYTGFQLAIGSANFCVNDNVAVQMLATCGYDVGFRRPGAGVAAGVGTTAREIDIVNEGAVSQIIPGNVYNAGFTAGLQINSGALSPFATTASHGLSFGNNGAKFNAAMVVGQNAINGVTLDANGAAIGGEGSAIRLGAFQTIEWWNNSGSTPTSKIVSRQQSPANVQEIAFEDVGIAFGGPTGAGRAITTVYPGGATGAYVSVTPAFGANAPVIGVVGASNSNLRLESRGVGLLSLDRSANTATAATAGTSSALPNLPAGYLRFTIGGTSTAFKLPYYND